jgi:hypothetical protein
MNVLQHLTSKAALRTEVQLTDEQVKLIGAVAIPEGHVLDTYLYVSNDGALCLHVGTRPSAEQRRAARPAATPTGAY